ncbi:hypothetical protein BVY01_00750 [bacterium I07]|nr:hypothetical protein BVY01_00750 [bacterium I07]
MPKNLSVLILWVIIAGCTSRPYQKNEDSRLDNEVRALRRELESTQSQLKRIEYLVKNLEKKLTAPHPNDTQTNLPNSSPTSPAQHGPPEVIRIWLVIYRGKVYQHGLFPTNYRGAIRKLGHEKTQNGYVVTFVSEYNPDVCWKALLPQKDGEFEIEAYRSK